MIRYILILCVLLNEGFGAKPTFDILTDYNLWEVRKEFEYVPLNKYTLKWAIEYLDDIEYPDKVFIHALKESGNLKSKLTREGHNLFGMKLPRKRQTYAIGVVYGHAKYECWIDSLLDYYIWQRQKKVTENCYWKYLKRRKYFGS